MSPFVLATAYEHAALRADHHLPAPSVRLTPCALSHGDCPAPEQYPRTLRNRTFTGGF